MMVHRLSSICPSGKCYSLELHICLSDLTVDKFVKVSNELLLSFSLSYFYGSSILSFPMTGLSVRVGISFYL